MPNWCSNSIKVTGETDNLSLLTAKIKSLLGTTQNLFENLLPEYSKPTGDNIQAYYVQTFGTKWDVSCNEELSLTEYSANEIYLCFDTAWTPPLGFCRLLARKFSLDIYIQFGEEGEDFYGNAAFDRQGSQLFINEYPYQEGIYKIDPEAFWFNCKYYLEDYYDNELSLAEILEQMSFITNDDDKNRIAEIYQEVSEEN